MKKSLFALAALTAFAGAAQAQSSVTIYGIVDAGITQVNSVATTAGGAGKSISGITNGGLSTPRLGFKGTEDLGGGLKANFNLETEILNDTGAQGDSTYLFNRQSWVNLEQTGVGALRLGRINRIDYDLAAKFDAFGGNNIGGWVALKDANANAATTNGNGSVSLKIGERIANAVEVKSASYNGLVVTLQNGFGEVAGSNSVGRTYALGLEYATGALEAAYAYSDKADSSSGTHTKQHSFYASYDFGVAKLVGGYVADQTDFTAAKPSGEFVGIRVPVGKVTYLAQYASLDNDAGATPKVYSLGATYGLSPRTTLYAIGAQNNGTGQSIVSSTKYSGFNTVASGTNARAISVGVRHSF